MNESYQQFVANVMADLGFESLPEGKKQELMEMIRKRTDQTVLLTIMSNLKGEDVKELDRLVEQNMPPEEMIGFMASRIEGLDQKITEALGELYEKMVTEVKTLAQTLA